MKYSDMMQKCEYTHFEAWILNGEITKNLAPLDKRAILQQVLVRDKEIIELQDKLHRRNMLCNARAKEIERLKNTIKILGEGLNAIRDAFYDTKQNPQVFIGNVETILNATKNKH